MRFVIFRYVSSCSGFHYSTNSISAGVSWPLKRPSKPPLELDGTGAAEGSAISLAAVVLLLRLEGEHSAYPKPVVVTIASRLKFVSVLWLLMANARKDGKEF